MTFGNFLKKTTNWIGESMSKVGQGFGNAIAKVEKTSDTILKGVSYGAGLIGDFAALAATVIPEAAAISEAMTAIKDMSNMGSNMLEGKGLLNSLGTGFTTLLKDEAFGALPGVSEAKAVADIYNKIKDSTSSVSNLTKRLNFSSLELD